MQNNPQLNFETHTPESEISQAANAAYAIMLQAVRNADLGLIPRLPDFNKPAQRYDEPTPEQDSYDSFAAFTDYRRRNTEAQPQKVVAVPENPDMLHEDEDSELDRIRRSIDNVHQEMSAETALSEQPTATVTQLESRRSFMNERPSYGQDERHAA